VEGRRPLSWSNAATAYKYSQCAKSRYTIVDAGRSSNSVYALFASEQVQLMSGLYKSSLKTSRQPASIPALFAYAVLCNCQFISTSPLKVRSATFMGADAFRRFTRSRAFAHHGARGGLRYRVDWLVACGCQAPAAVRILCFRLEQIFVNFARVPCHDVRALRELEQILDDLEDLTGAP
jgi:hypothetical protein